MNRNYEISHKFAINEVHRLQQRIKELETQLARAEERLKLYADRSKWRYTYRYRWATNEFGPEPAQDYFKEE